MRSPVLGETTPPQRTLLPCLKWEAMGTEAREDDQAGGIHQEELDAEPTDLSPTWKKALNPNCGTRSCEADRKNSPFSKLVNPFLKIRSGQRIQYDASPRQ